MRLNNYAERRSKAAALIENTFSPTPSLPVYSSNTLQRGRSNVQLADELVVNRMGQSL